MPEENNDREARKKLQNQLIIQSQLIKAQQSQAVRALQQQQAQIVALLLENQCSLFQMNCVSFVSEIVFNLFLLFTGKLCFIKFCST